MTAPGASARPVRAFATRLLALATIFGLAVIGELRGASGSTDGLETMYALVLVGFLLTLAYGALAAWGAGRRLVWLELLGDGLFLTALVSVTGGARSLFAFLYVIWIVNGALAAGSRGALVSASLATVGYAAVAWASVEGFAPSHAAEPLLAREAGVAIVRHAAAFIAVALLARRLAGEVQAGRKELDELAEIHRRIVDNVSSGLLTFDSRGRITSFNTEAERITGRRPHEVLGASLADLFPDIEHTARAHTKFVNEAGETLHLGTSVSALRGRDGAADGGILIFQDLTRVIEMEEELRRRERLAAVGQLAAGLAHEIRNPLASLSGSIELLAADLPAGDTSSRRLADIVRRETARLNRLVQDFLTYARPGTGRFVRVDVGELAEELATLARGGDMGAELVVELEAGLAALGNPDQLRQVFWNLILNAVEAEPADGRVVFRGRSVATVDGRASVLIEIVDLGSGIPDAEIDRVFEPFFTTKPTGTGLGLATVHRVVEAHGGELSVRSEVGKGTTVRLLLPACAT